MIAHRIPLLSVTDNFNDLTSLQSLLVIISEELDCPLSTHQIDVNLKKARLRYLEDESVKLETHIVHGCDDTPSITGKLRAGKWIKDKTNATYGPVPWSEDRWSNPYGPYFLQILDQSGFYTSYGIHGTIGFGWSPFVKPPLPQFLLQLFTEEAKYLYCSHGCIRIPNGDINELFHLTSAILAAGTEIAITISGS